MPLPDSTFSVTTDDAVATLWLDCATLTPARVVELVACAEAVAARPAVEVLVLRAARPGGYPTFDRPFLRELRSNADASEYARVGQLALRRFAELPVPTVAFLEGPCVGPGLELALACDHRLAVATPDAVLGFGEWPTVWGGRTRLAKRIGRRTVSRFVDCYPREAAKLGLVDDAFCLRRAKIELRTFLDRLQFRPTKRGIPTDVIGEAEERKRFRAAMGNGFAVPSAPTLDPVNPIPVRPRRVGVIGTGPQTRRWVSEFALRGMPVTWQGAADANPLAEPLRRGRVTPLEADQATARVTAVAEPDDVLTADLVVIDASDDTGAAYLERVMPVRSVLLVPAGDLEGVLPSCARPGRVLGWEAVGGRTTIFAHPDATDDATATAMHWLSLTGDAVEVKRVVPVPQKVETEVEKPALAVAQ